jgi:hypothetical protein|tara:strand:- start:1102 stop:2160 length:1059 start_codon:yes stop_codon:yes gene_type:complete
MKNILLIYRGQVFDTEIKPRLEQYKNDNVVLIVDNKLTRKIVGYLTADYEQKINIITIHEYINKGVVDNMKFDVIIGNPPYQLQVGPSKTEPIWNKVVEKSIEQLKDSGEISVIHPIGWRAVGGKPSIKKIFNLYKTYNLTRVDMHDIKDGMKTFNAKTPYDVVYLKKEPYQNKTELNFMDGTQEIVDISDMDFIPNSRLSEVMNLVAKPNEEKVEVLFSSSIYETRHKHMSPKKVGEFKYPCVYTILGDETTNLYYSNVKKDFFGVPKLIITLGLNPTFKMDLEGKYGMTQFCYAVVDTKENLPKILKAIKSEKFQELITSPTKFTNTIGGPLIHNRVLELFRKDFWKDFV